MATEVQRHEPRQLQKAGIDLPAEAWIRKWNSVQTVAAEPFDAALLGELVDFGRTASAVDRAAHQGHAGGGGSIAGGLHERHRRKQRHGRLTNSKGVDAGAKIFENLA